MNTINVVSFLETLFGRSMSFTDASSGLFKSSFSISLETTSKVGYKQVKCAFIRKTSQNSSDKKHKVNFVSKYSMWSGQSLSGGMEWVGTTVNGSS